MRGVKHKEDKGHKFIIRKTSEPFLSTEYENAGASSAKL
jgi:hypothetical protein